MKRGLVIIALCAVVFGGAYVVQQWHGGPKVPVRPTPAGLSGEITPRRLDCSRIIAMAPSITETLFALGLGDQVVGVTRYVEFPPEATKRPSVGGFFDPNYEQMLALNPTLVVALGGQEEQLQRLRELGFELLEARQANVTEILASIHLIGGACGLAQRGAELVDELSRLQERVENRTAHLPSPGVLIVVDREMGTGKIRDLYVAGKETFYDDLLTLAGGTNVYDGKIIQYPTLSLEGLMRVNPQVIIEIVPKLAQRGFTADALRRDWDAVPTLNAVKSNRIVILDDSFAAVPGPRYVQLLEAMARAIHPEADWGEP
jgi:iron complex transport system substrate-binding protein